MGYLGKISAIVTANTGDFKPKLDAAASDVQKFARTVQSNLTSASSSASKAFEGIYTPLQKLERGLQAAASMKLSFKGFEGALRDVDALKNRLASLGKRQIDISVTGTGFAKVSELRDAISKITSKDVKIVAGFGGLDQARQLLAAMNSTGSKGSTFWANGDQMVKIKQGNLAEVLAKFEKLQSLSQIDAAIKVVGEQGLQESLLRMRQMYSAAEDIAKPLSEAARVSASLGQAMQAGIGPALKAAQVEAEAVKQTITNGMAVAEDRFSSVGRQVRLLVADMKQLAEAQNLVSGMKTGQELAFANPRLAAQLAQASALGGRAAGMPEAFLSSNGNVAGLVQQINSVSQKAADAYAKVRGATSGRDSADATAELARIQGVLDGLLSKLSKQLPLDVDTTQAVAKVDALTLKFNALSESAAAALSGKPQTMTQASSEFNRIIGQFEKLSAAQRSALSPNVNDFLSAFKGGEANIANILVALQRLDDETQKQLQVIIDTETAKAKVDALKDSLRGIAGGITPNLSPMDQLRKDAEEAKAAVDKVKDATTKAMLEGRLSGTASRLSALADPANPAVAGMSDAEIERMMRREQARLRTTAAMAGAAAPQRTVDDVFGASLGSMPSKLSGLESRIKSLQSSISQLPEPIQAKMIPALERARNAFFALGQNPTARELARAAQEAGNLERNLKRAQTAAQFRGNFGSFLNSNAASNYAAQLNAIRQGMAAVGATASGPVATAIGKYQKALIDSARAGTLATDATKKDLDELLNKIAQVAQAEGNLKNKTQATAFVQNVQRSGAGDVGRMGMEKFNLAMQQGAFAVDDFMSSTGGLEFKLRAISNNLTQMAFILGSTKGLWLAVGAVIATTVGIPILKAIFDFSRFEHQNKALNDELEKSKGVAEKTAEAYKELGKALRESGIGSGRAKAEDFANARRAEATELAKSRVFGNNVEFAKAQSRVVSLEGQVEKSTDIGTRARLLRELDQARRERDAIKSQGLAPSSFEDINARLDAARQAEIKLRLSSRNPYDATSGFSSRMEAGRLSRESASNVQTPEKAIEAIKKRVEGLNDSLDNANIFTRTIADFLPAPFGGSQAGKVRQAREEIARLEEERARLEQDAVLRRNERFMPRAMAAAAAAELTPGVRDQVSRLGLGGNVTSQFDSQIAGVSKEFADIITQLEKVTREGGDTAELEKAADDAAKALEFLYREADKFARDVALGALVPTKDRLDRAAEQLSGIGPSNIATDIARAQARRQELEGERDRARTRGDEFGANRAEYELDRVDRLTTELEAAANAVAIFQRAIEEAAMALSRTLVQEAQNRAQELRRAANRFSDNPAYASAAAEAEAESKKQKERDRTLNRSLNQERLAFEAEIPGNAELSALAERVRAGNAGAKDNTKSAAQQEAARMDAEDAQLELERRFERREGVRRARASVDEASGVVDREKDRIARENDRRSAVMGGVDADARSALSAAVSSEFTMPNAVQSGADLVEESRELGRRVGEAIAAGIESPFDDEVAALREKVDKFNSEITDALVRQAKLGDRSVEQLAQSSREEIRGAGPSDVEGKITEMEVRKRRLDEQRRAAIAEGTPEGAERAVALTEEIAAMESLAVEVAAAAVAVGGFQKAMQDAALALQSSIMNESSGRAVDARRSANEAEAVFGVGSPEARRARGRQERAEEAMRTAETERREAEAAISNERVRFEREMEDGTDPASAARAREIKRLEQVAADQNLPAQQRVDAQNEARRLREEQQREFESRPEVRAQRDRADKADREMQRRQSIERGLEMGRTEEDKRKEEVRRQAGDLGNAARFLMAEGRGREVSGLARNAAINMAKDAAPLYAQLTEEVMTARLQGPSRAALNVSDISTSQGASELNRLLRGDDSAKDVNLAELKKQSNLLEAIERAVLNSTGVVVNL